MDPDKAYKFCLFCAGPLVRHPSSLHALLCSKCSRNHFISPLPTNGIIIENKKGEILLTKRGIEPYKDYWDVPGGFLHPGESLEESVTREAGEELSVSVVTNAIVGVYADSYLYQGVCEPTLTIIVSASIEKGVLAPADDVASFAFVPKTGVLRKKIAFRAVQSGLRDYLANFSS